METEFTNEAFKRNKEAYSGHELSEILNDFKELQTLLLSTNPLPNGSAKWTITNQVRKFKNVFASFSNVEEAYWDIDVAQSYEGCKDEVETVIEGITRELDKRSKK